MAEKETSLLDWRDVLEQKPEGMDLHTKVYLAIVSYFLIPIIIAATFNKLGVMHWNWLIVGLLTLVDLYIITKPWPAVGISLAAFIRGQVGGEKGLDAEDGVNRVSAWMKSVYSVALIVILAKQIAIVALALLPIARNEYAVAVILGVVLLAILGSLVFSKGAWIVVFFWKLYVLLLAGAVAYWILVSIFPELRHSAVHAEANQTEEEMRDIYDRYLKTEQGRIKKILKEMPVALTYEEKVARLTPADQRLWATITRSSFTGKSAALIKVKADEGMNQVQTTLGKARGTTTPPTEAPTAETVQKMVTATVWDNCSSYKEIDYTPSEVRGRLAIGTLPAGRYKITAQGSRWQNFLRDDGAVSERCEMDANGNIGICRDGQDRRVTKNRGWLPWIAPDNLYRRDGEGEVLRGEPYGRFILHALGHPLSIGANGTLETDTPTDAFVDVNNFQHIENYGGSGMLRISIKKC